MNYFINLYKGRLNRQNYLLGTFIVFLFGLLLLYVQEIHSEILVKPLTVGITILIGVYLLVFSYSLIARRAHDAGYKFKSTNNFFAWLILYPSIYTFIALWLFFPEGDQSTNRFGSKPKAGIDLLELFKLK